MNELLARFLKERGTLSAAEFALLARQLEVCPEAIEELRAQLVCDELLSRHFDEDRAVFVARVKQAAAKTEGRPATAGVLRRHGFVATVERRIGFK